MFNKFWTGAIGAGTLSFVALMVYQATQIEKTDTKMDVQNAAFDEAWHESAAQFEKNSAAIAGRKVDKQALERAEKGAEEARDRKAKAEKRLEDLQKDADSDLQELRKELDSEREKAGVGPNRDAKPQVQAKADDDPLKDMWEQ